MKSQTVKTNPEVSPKPNSPLLKLIEQAGIKGIVPNVVKAIMSPLINLIANRDGDDAGSALNKSITLIAVSDPKNQLELMLATQFTMTHLTSIFNVKDIKLNTPTTPLSEHPRVSSGVYAVYEKTDTMKIGLIIIDPSKLDYIKTMLS